MDSYSGSIVNEVLSNMQRSLSASLYWYVEKSLEDLLEGFMAIIQEEQIMSLNVEEAAAEISRLITSMLDLPLEFDTTSMNLSVTIILGTVQRHIKSTTACKYLLVTLLKRNSEVSAILKADILTLLEQKFFREVKKSDYLKPQKVRVKGAGLVKPKHGNKMSKIMPSDTTEDEEELHPKVELYAYAEILVELYQKDFVTATQMLVYLEQLSNKEPSYYRTDLLLFLLSRIGVSVENKLCRGVYVRQNPSTPTTCSTLSRLRFHSDSKTTFEGIYKRLDSLLPYAISTESKKAFEKITHERKLMRTRGAMAKKTRSKESFRNSSMHRGQTCHLNKTLFSQPFGKVDETTPVSSASIQSVVSVDKMELITSL